jgi:YegS/Rv2252/BmrU family lipid kinase
LNKQSKYLVVVNPNAGKKQSAKDWPIIADLLSKHKILFDVFFTEYRHHAIKLVAKEIEQFGYQKIIAVGGDGTINEVVNGIFLQDRFPTTDISLGVITIGTGNDWAKMFLIPKEYSKAIALIKNGNTFMQDVGKVHYYLGERLLSRYFINAAGLGFDALVTNHTNLQKDTDKSSIAMYFTSMIKSLYRYTPVKVQVNTRKRIILDGSLFTLSLGIGKYTGGGMQQTPEAISDDGLFDLMLVNQITKTKLLRKVKKLFDGNIRKIKEVQYLQTDYLRVESDSKLLIEVDGENIGHAPFEFEILSRSLKIYVP